MACTEFLMDLYSDKVVVGFKDRYHDAIVDAALSWQSEHPGERFKFKNIYFRVCRNLGASIPHAMKGLAPDPYGDGSLKDVRGLIRSWVEERSPHSRQHYFRAGRRTQEGWRPCFFVNPGLEAANSAVEWKPYRAVRGNGWLFSPEVAASYKKPSEEVLVAAALEIRGKGMRGHPRTKTVCDVPDIRRKFSFQKAAVTAVGTFVVASTFAAAFKPSA